MSKFDIQSVFCYSTYDIRRFTITYLFCRLCHPARFRVMGKTSKVIVCGAKKCGKTTILEQAIYGQVGVGSLHNGSSIKHLHLKYVFLSFSRFHPL